uniref:glucuronosyltransferase n=1 Tax=Acrobeloides nanus TaxID=290746 RepID=A0A914E0N6_9BILA
MSFLLSILFFVGLICSSLSFKVLLYNTGSSKSHIQFGGALVNTLVDRGHVVDLLIMSWNPNVNSNGTYLARNIYRINLNEESPWTRMDHLVDSMRPQTVSFSHPIYEETRQEFCKTLLNQSDFIERLKIEQYDVGISSLYDHCGLGLFYLLGIRSTMGFFPTPMMDWTGWELGLPMAPSYISDLLCDQT